MGRPNELRLLYHRNIIGGRDGAWAYAASAVHGFGGHARNRRFPWDEIDLAVDIHLMPYAEHDVDARA